MDGVVHSRYAGRTGYVKRDEWRWVEFWFVGIKMMVDAFRWNLVKMCRKMSSD